MSDIQPWSAGGPGAQDSTVEHPVHRAPLLIVDDTPANLVAFGAVLESDRHDIVLASSGREALARVESTDFAAILLDVRMPDLSGYDTAALIRRRSKGKAAPILFVTGSDASSQEVADAYSLGGVDFLRKPVDDTILRSKVAVFVDLYFERAEARRWARELTESSERRLRLIFEQMPVNLCAVNRDLRITFADGLHVRAQGRGGGAIVGRLVTDFADSDERPLIEKAFRAALAGQCSIYESRFEGKIYSANVQPLLDSKKSIIGAICGFMDVTALKEAERRVLEQKNLLEALFRTATDAVFVKDLAGRFLMVNQAGAESFGKTAAEVIGKTDGDILPEATARDCRESDRRVLESGHPLITEEQIETPDGTHTCRVSKAPLCDGEGKVVGIVGIAHDVTDLIRAKEQLRRSDDRFRLAMKATNEVIWDWNVASGDVVWSGAVARLLDFDAVPEPIPIERARTLWLEKLHPEDRGRVLESFQAALKGDAEAWSLEYRHLRPDGRAPWMLDRAIILRDGAGKAIRVVGSLLEITRQKESEERLSELNRTLEARVAESGGQLLASQERLRLAVEGAAMGTWDSDMATGAVRWSEVMARLLGYDPARVTPTFELWTSRIHPEDRERVLAEVERARNEGGPYQVEYRILTADTGELRWISSRGGATRDGQGRIALFSGVSFDVSTLKRAQEMLQRALEESDAFARNAAHELRAPLRAMACTAQLLLEECSEKSLGPEERAHFERLIGATRRLDAMTQDLLAYSRVAQSDASPGVIDSHAVLTETLERMKDALTESRAELRVAKAFPRVRGHGPMLGHALGNLLYNAIKFVPAGATPRVGLSWERRGPWVRFCVEDNGIGIDPREAGRLFQVFERLRPTEYPGTGVGLAMVRRAIERMGGKVGVESVPGRGSRFWIDLPSADEGPGEKAAARPGP